MEFSEKLKFARKKLMMSQEEMARELGVTFTTLNRWENKKNEPSYVAQRKFAELCKKHEINFGGEANG